MTAFAWIAFGLLVATYIASAFFAFVSVACDIVEDENPERRLTWRDVVLVAVSPVMVIAGLIAVAWHKWRRVE